MLLLRPYLAEKLVALPVNRSLPLARVPHAGTSMSLSLTEVPFKPVCTIRPIRLTPPMLISNVDAGRALLVPLKAMEIVGVHNALDMLPTLDILPITRRSTLLFTVMTLMSQWAVSVLPTALPVSVVLAVTAEIKAILTSRVVLAVVTCCGPPRTPVRVIAVEGFASEVNVLMFPTRAGT